MIRMFFATMKERDAHPIGSADWNALDRACRKYLKWMLGIPAQNWSQ